MKSRRFSTTGRELAPTRRCRDGRRRSRSGLDDLEVRHRRAASAASHLQLDHEPWHEVPPGDGPRRHRAMRLVRDDGGSSGPFGASNPAPRRAGSDDHGWIGVEPAKLASTAGSDQIDAPSDQPNHIGVATATPLRRNVVMETNRFRLGTFGNGITATSERRSGGCLACQRAARLADAAGAGLSGRAMRAPMASTSAVGR